MKKNYLKEGLPYLADNSEDTPCEEQETADEINRLPFFKGSGSVNAEENTLKNTGKTEK